MAPELLPRISGRRSAPPFDPWEKLRRQAGGRRAFGKTDLDPPRAVGAPVGWVGSSVALQCEARCTFLPEGTVPGKEEAVVHDEMKRHAVRVLRGAGHTQCEVSEQLGVSVRTIRGIETEAAMQPENERRKACGRGVGRPSKVAPFEEYIGQLLREEPELRTLEILRRCRERGYAGGKSAL